MMEPMRVRWRSNSRGSCAPNRRTSPSVGNASPHSSLNSVVLPAPLSPTTPNMSPRRTLTSASYSAQTSPP